MKSKKQNVTTKSSAKIMLVICELIWLQQLKAQI